MSGIFKAIYLFLAAFPLYGCVAKPKVYAYGTLGFSIIKASPSVVNMACSGKDQLLDNGRYRTNADTIIGCWDSVQREIWVSWEHPEILIHELAHIEGIKNPRSEGYTW